MRLVHLASVIVAAAFLPNPPLLVPAVASGASAELEPLRQACRIALRRVNDSGATQLALVGSGDTSAMHSPVARGSLTSRS